jgi:hypothetical protein
VADSLGDTADILYFPPVADQGGAVHKPPLQAHRIDQDWYLASDEFEGSWRGIGASKSQRLSERVFAIMFFGWTAK